VNRCAQGDESLLELRQRKIGIPWIDNHETGMSLGEALDFVKVI